MKEKFISIKPSPVVVLKKILIIEVLVAIIVAVFTFIIDFIEIYSTFPFAETLPSSVFTMILLVSSQMILLIGVFLSWYFEVYELHREKLVHKKGVFFKSNEIRPFEKITSIRRREGILGKWMNYASIVLEDSKNSQVIVMRDVYRPDDEIESIQKLINFSASKKNITTHSSEIEQLIKKGESKTLEFKASFRWDINKGSSSKDIEAVIVKSITALMNTVGGKLLIGVSDRGEIVGLQNDIKSLRKKSIDGLENHFTTTFSTLVGTAYTRNYEMKFLKCDELDVCIVEVEKATEPVFFKTGSDEEKFYVRAGNSTRELSISEALKYIRSNFPEFGG